MRSWVDVAYLAKLRNLDGRFVVRSTAGLPFLLEVGDEVSLVPPKLDVPRNLTVSEVNELGDDSAEVRFDGISNADEAWELVGMHCLIRRDLLDDVVFASAPGLWEGWKVVDGRLGEIGTVMGLIDNPAQSLLEVDHAGNTVLVPLVDEIVLDVDVAGNVIRVDLPSGLLEL